MTMEVEQGPPVRRPVFGEAEDSPVRKLHPSLARRHVTSVSARAARVTNIFWRVRDPFRLLGERTRNVGICQELETKLVGVDRSDDGSTNRVSASAFHADANGAATLHKDAIHLRVTLDRSAVIRRELHQRFYQYVGTAMRQRHAGSDERSKK